MDPGLPSKLRGALPRSDVPNRDVAPVRRITNSAFTSAEQVAVAADEIYVSSFGKSVLVFPVGANGDVMSTRQITGATTRLNSAAGLFLTF